MKIKFIPNCFVISLFLLFVSFSSTQEEYTIDKWKKDECGCDRVRTVPFAEHLVNTYSLDKGKTHKEVIKVLGKPNKKQGTKAKLQFVYYIQTDCYKGKKAKDSLSWSELTIFFNENKKSCYFSLTAHG